MTPAPYWADDAVTVWHGDCLEVMTGMPDASVDAVVTDPPYGLEFMGQEWDRFSTGRAAKYAGGGHLDPKAIAAQSGKGGAGPSYVTRPAKRCAACGRQAWSGSPCSCPVPRWTVDNSPLHAFQAWCEQWAAEAFRLLKPGGHLLAFGGTRTWHRLACAIEDAGFELRDSIAWLYGSGFPKSLDVSKAIDKAAGAERAVVGQRAAFPDGTRGAIPRPGGRPRDVTGLTGMPDPGGLVDVTAPATGAARQWQGWGTALKPAFEPVVVARKPLAGTVAANVLAYGTGAINVDGCRVSGAVPSVPRGAFAGSNNNMAMDGRNGTMSEPHAAGRWPTNVVLDEATAADLDQQTGDRPGMAPAVLRRGSTTGRSIGFGGAEPQEAVAGYADAGGASRFFPTFRYEPKAPTDERPRDEGGAHPTVKPLDLMRWLVRLVTPPGGLVLDPFAGSGTTAEACVIEGARCVTIEREAGYLPLVVARLSKPIQPDLFGLDA